MEITQFPSDGPGISEMIFKVFRHSLGVLPRPSLGAAASPAHSLTRRGNFTFSLVGPQAPKGVGWVVISFMVSPCLSASCLMSSLIKPKPKAGVVQGLPRVVQLDVPMTSTIIFRHGWCLLAGLQESQ